jgi:hypothetical protein
MGSNNIGNLPRQTPLSDMMPLQNSKVNGEIKNPGMQIIYGDQAKGERLNAALNNLKNLQTAVQNHIGNIIPGTAE